jgi:hypothetical protein
MARAMVLAVVYLVFLMSLAGRRGGIVLPGSRMAGVGVPFGGGRQRRTVAVMVVRSFGIGAGTRGIRTLQRFGTLGAQRRLDQRRQARDRRSAG